MSMTAKPTTSNDALVRIGASRSWREYLSEAWQRRDLAINLALADIRANNVDSVLGNVWQLLNPILLVSVYYLIFGVIFEITRGGVDNYLGFLVIGVFMFTLTRKSAASGARAIVNNRALVQNIQFPRVLLPTAIILGEFLSFLPSILVMYVVEILTGERVGATWLLLFPVIVLQLGFHLGLALITARWTVHFRDLEQLLPFLLRLWFYLSGVLYPVGRIAEALGPLWGTLFRANPAHVYIDLVRQAIMDNTGSDWTLWSMGVGWSFGILVVGFVFFRRHEYEYGDV